MAPRKPKVTHPSTREFHEKTKAKVKKYVIDSDRSVMNNENKAKAPHVLTDGRSSAGIQTQKNKYGGKGVATNSPNGRMAIEVREGNSGKTTYDTKNATTNLFTDKENGNQAGRRNLTAKQKAEGQKAWQGNRRQRDYLVRVGLNNDERSPEAIQRLRNLGLTDDEIGVGGGGAGGGWRGLATG